MTISWPSVEISEEETIFRQTIRKFVEEVINPNESRAKRDFIGVCRELRLEAGKRGILGLSVPPQYGGQGASNVMIGIANEEIGRSRIVGSFIPRPLPTMVSDFAQQGKENLVKQWLPKFINGEARLGIASTEPNSGSDVANISTTAVKSGESYILKGEKGPISTAETANGWIVLARTGPPDSGAKGISRFFVERDLKGIEKYTIGGMDETEPLGGIILNNVEVPSDHLLGEENKGFYSQMGVFSIERALLSMPHLGSAMDSLELSVEYAQNRVVWGKPIASFEGVMFPLVEAITKIESVRAFAYQVLRMADDGKSIAKEASMLRWYIPRLVLEALDTCIQVYGASGYADVVPHQRRYRTVSGALIGHGSQEIEKLVIGKDIFGKDVYNMAMGRN